MRTKTLLLTAALTAAGIAYTTAQTVYSVNVVGYVNKTCVANGYTLLNNPLNATNNSINTIIPVAPDGATVVRWDAAGQGFAAEAPAFSSFTGKWDPDATLNPGEGFFLLNLDPAPFTVTFVGEVLTGSLTNVIAPQYNLLGSKVPQALGLKAAGVPAADGDTVLFWDPATQNYEAIAPQFVEFTGNWDPEEPTPDVGEGFFYLSTSTQPKNWVRTFTIN